MGRFDNRTVIVTGGSRGMGASHARGFVAEGANVVIADVLEQEGRTLADELGGRAVFSRLDVTSDRPDAVAMAATMAGAGVGLSAIPRIAEPEEITRMVLFVASDDASFSTGSEFIADGGLLLGPVPQHERAEAAVA